MLHYRPIQCVEKLCCAATDRKPQTDSAWKIIVVRFEEPIPKRAGQKARGYVFQMKPTILQYLCFGYRTASSHTWQVNDQNLAFRLQNAIRTRKHAVHSEYCAWHGLVPPRVPDHSVFLGTGKGRWPLLHPPKLHRACSLPNVLTGRGNKAGDRPTTYDASTLEVTFP